MKFGGKFDLLYEIDRIIKKMSYYTSIKYLTIIIINCILVLSKITTGVYPEPYRVLLFYPNWLAESCPFSKEFGNVPRGTLDTTLGFFVLNPTGGIKWLL